MFFFITKKKIIKKPLAYVFWPLQRTLRLKRCLHPYWEHWWNTWNFFFFSFFGDNIWPPWVRIRIRCHSFVSPYVGGYSHTYAATNQHAEIDEEGEEVGRSVVTKLLFDTSLTRDFQLPWFFSWISVPVPMNIPLKPFRIITKIRDYIRI